jgi:hypothetical protein
MEKRPLFMYKDFWLWHIILYEKRHGKKSDCGSLDRIDEIMSRGAHSW